MEINSIFGGIIAGIIATIIWWILENSICFNYKHKITKLLYNLYSEVVLLENGIEYFNEIMIYSSLDRIQHTANEILNCDKAFNFFNRKKIKVIHTLAILCISIVNHVGQSEKGYNNKREKEARIKEIKNAFWFDDEHRCYSNFIINLIFNINKNLHIRKDEIHILDNKLLPGIASENYNISICKDNDEIYEILK